MTKKFIYTILACLLFISLFGCVKKTVITTISFDDSKKLPTEGNSWDYWDDERYDDGEIIEINWYVSPSWSWSGSRGTLVSEMIEKKTGCRINFTTGGGDNSKLTTMIAGDKLPDVLTVEVGDAIHIQLAEQGYLYSITDLSEYYAPNFMKTYSKEIQTLFAASDSKLYGCPQLFYSEQDLEYYANQNGYIIPNRVMCARRDVVNWYRTNYPEDYKKITTPDGLIKFIHKAIEDPTSGYDTDTTTYSAVQIAPWTATSESETISLLKEYFAVPRETADGNLTYEKEQEEYKEVLLFLNRLYREGLISQSAVSETENVGGNIQNGRPLVTMVTPQNWQSNFYNYNKTHYDQSNPDDGSDYIPILITNSNGDTPVIQNLCGRGYMYSMITKNCKRPDRVIKLFDYLNSQEGQMVQLYGVEDITYEWDIKPGEQDTNGVTYVYGKIKMELRYFLNFMFVLVTKNANKPPKRIDIQQVHTDKIMVFKSGVQRFALASLEVNRSM